MSSKAKTIYACQKCSAQFPKWIGQCTECGAWNSLVEENFTASAGKDQRFTNFAGSASKAIALGEINLTTTPRISTGIEELDRVLGGGVVSGSVILVGGDPGVGKSTLLLQALGNLCQIHSALYVTGEESLQQVAMRAYRLDVNAQKMQLLAETNAEKIIAQAQQQKPEAIVIDSIQTINSDLLQSAPGSVSQVRESAAMLVRYAKQTNTVLFIIGHVTKDGTIAGPRVLEHMVDCVLYFEGESDNRYRVVRAIKNRFGAVNELGIFAMLDNGLKEVNNPSAIFLSRHEKPVSGSIITVTWEGSRPLLVELQALVDESYLANPRRVTLGLEQNRLAMLLAVLNRHGHIKTFKQDVFINIVGGIKVTETAADLPLLLAIISSLTDRPLAVDLIAFGEVGLSGEIRPVQNGQDRLKTAAKHGFKRAIIPKANAPKKPLENIEVIPVKNLSEAIKNLAI
jgi:DNA repair protein RadA/Sms